MVIACASVRPEGINRGSAHVSILHVWLETIKQMSRLLAFKSGTQIHARPKPPFHGRRLLGHVDRAVTAATIARRAWGAAAGQTLPARGSRGSDGSCPCSNAPGRRCAATAALIQARSSRAPSRSSEGEGNET